MIKLKAWCLLFLVFFAGFAGGVAVTRGVVRHIVQQAVNNPDRFRDRIEARLASGLRLRPDQRAKVHEIFLHTHEDMKSLRGEFQPRFAAILDRAQSDIAATLTPEQREPFEKFKQENRHLWQTR